MPRDDFSRAESLEARIDKLVSEGEQLQRNRQSMADMPELRMTHDICHAYQAEANEDARSLQRVLSRLVENGTATRSKVIFFPHSDPFQERMPEMQNTMNALAQGQPKTTGGWMRRLSLFAAVLCLILLVGGFLTVLNATRTRPGTSGAGSSPSAPFQEAIYNSNYAPIDQVYCDQLERTVLHVHAHVSIYINGQLAPIPPNVGIPLNASGQPICYYWLHTHDASGVIHIESPVKETFTFGQFRDEWYQKFQSLGFPNQLLQNSGWTIWLNGHTYTGTLESIPLAAHNLITIAYNSPNVRPDTHYAWGGL